MVSLRRNVDRHTPYNNLEATETTGMEQDENNYYLSITHAAGLVTMFRSLPSTIYFSYCNANSLQKSSAIQ